MLLTNQAYGSQSINTWHKCYVFFWKFMTRCTLFTTMNKSKFVQGNDVRLSPPNLITIINLFRSEACRIFITKSKLSSIVNNIFNELHLLRQWDLDAAALASLSVLLPFIVAWKGLFCFSEIFHFSVGFSSPLQFYHFEYAFSYTPCFAIRIIQIRWLFFEILANIGFKPNLHIPVTICMC